MNKFEELKNAAVPVVEFLLDNCDPHTSVTVTDTGIVLNREEMSLPVAPRD